MESALGGLSPPYSDSAWAPGDPRKEGVKTSEEWDE